MNKSQSHLPGSMERLSPRPSALSPANDRRIDAVESLCEGDIRHFGHVMFMVQNGPTPPRHSVAVCSETTGGAMAQVRFGTLLNRPGTDPFYLFGRPAPASEWS